MAGPPPVTHARFVAVNTPVGSDQSVGRCHQIRCVAGAGDVIEIVTRDGNPGVPRGVRGLPGHESLTGDVRMVLSHSA